MSRGVAQFGSAFPWGGKGRTFESCRPDHCFQNAFRDVECGCSQPLLPVESCSTLKSEPCFVEKQNRHFEAILPPNEFRAVKAVARDTHSTTRIASEDLLLGNIRDAAWNDGNRAKRGSTKRKFCAVFVCHCTDCGAEANLLQWNLPIMLHPKLYKWN